MHSWPSGLLLLVLRLSCLLCWLIEQQSNPQGWNLARDRPRCVFVFFHVAFQRYPLLKWGPNIRCDLSSQSSAVTAQFSARSVLYRCFGAGNAGLSLSFDVSMKMFVNVMQLKLGEGELNTNSPRQQQVHLWVSFWQRIEPWKFTKTQSYNYQHWCSCPSVLVDWW